MSITRSITRPIASSLARGLTAAGVGGGWSVESAMFGNGEQGVWYDPSDFSSLWQDAGRTVPVTATGQTVAVMDDKSGNGNHITLTNCTVQVDGSGCYYIAFNGTNARGVTGAIDLTGTASVTCIAGLYKSNSTGTQIIAELSAVANSNPGAFAISGPSGGTDVIQWVIRGATATSTRTALVAAATPCVFTGQANLQAISTSIRLNGSLSAAATPATGATNWGNYALYIGARAGSSLFWAGRMYQFILRGAETSPFDMVRAENLTAEKTGITVFGAVQNVVLVAGQSNAVGLVAFDSGSTHPANVFQYKQDATVTGPSNTLDHFTAISGYMGFDITFSQDFMSGRTNESLVFIPCGKPSTSFSSNNWNPGDTEYENTVARVNAAMALLPNPRLVGILWHQGEGDAGNATEAGNYAGRLDAMIAAMRSAISGAASVPFIVGGLSEDWYVGTASRETVQAVLEDTPARVANTAYASSAGLAGKVGEEIHFDAPALRTLGSRYHDELEALTP